MPAWTETLGIIFMPVGGMLALSCAAVFIARGRGTPAPFDAPEEFVAAGPYKYVRNPMYIGALVLLIGFGLYLHSISILLLSLVVFLLVGLFVVYFEEPNLSRKFGARPIGRPPKGANRLLDRADGTPLHLACLA